MRRFIAPIMAISLAAAPAAVQAQTPQRGAAATPAERILSLREELGLTPQQILQIQRIGGQLEEQNRALREQLMQERAGSGQRERMRERVQSMTPEHRQQMRAGMEQRRDSMQSQRERMRERVQSLTPEQRQQLRRRMEQRRDSVGARAPMARAGARIAPRRVEAVSPVMEEMRANQQRAMEQIRATLTPEQLTKLQQLRPAPVRGAVPRPAGR